MISSARKYADTKIPNISKAVVSNIVLFSIISLFMISKAKSEEYIIPQPIIDLCIIGSPFFGASEISGATKPFQGAGSTFKFFKLLLNGVSTPEKCRSELPKAMAELEQFVFQKQLSSCSNENLSTIGQSYERGNWFCNSLNIEDWHDFRDWVETEEGRTWLEEKTSLKKEDIFVPPPTIDLTKYGPKKTDNFSDCMNAADNAAVRRICAQKEEQRHDAILNTAYQCLREKLSSGEFSQLQTSQRAWIENREVECAYSEERGTLKHDLVASCWLEATVNKSFELAMRARNQGCDIPAPDTIHHDLDVWRNVDGEPTVSNNAQLRLSLVCGVNGYGALSTLDGSKLEDLVPTGDPIDFFFMDSRETLIARLDLQFSFVEQELRFPITPYVLDLLKKASRVTVDADPFGTEFNLRGSSSAIDNCAPSENATPAPASQNVSVINHPTYTPSSESFFIDIPGDLPMRVRCDRPFPEAYIQSSGVFNWIFGNNVTEGDSWSFDAITRDGSSKRNHITEATRLNDDTIGFQLSVALLDAARNSSKLTVSGGGKEYEIPISALSRDFDMCRNRASNELEKYVVGQWQNGAATNRIMVIDPRTVNTFLGPRDLGGGRVLLPRLFVVFDGNKEIYRNVWMLAPNGNLHINYNEFICVVEASPSGLRLESMFDCRLRGEWQRRG